MNTNEQKTKIAEKLKVVCLNCGHYYCPRDPLSAKCPKCKNVLDYSTRLQIYNGMPTKRKCLRCQHEWTQREITTPIRCPKCNSKYWYRHKSGEFFEIIQGKRAYYRIVPGEGKVYIK